MQYQFTSGAERVLRYAAGCISPIDYADLAAPAILLGLLTESECRAALLLAQHNITVDSVREHWPGLLLPPPNSSTTKLLTFRDKLHSSFQAVCELLEQFVHPPTIVTEHLLLSLLMADDELSSWLNKQGLRREEIEADICKNIGPQAQPLPNEVMPLNFSDENEEGSGFRVQDSELEIPRSVVSGQCETASGFVHHSSLLRILDAAANRTREGLRVAEDFVRFVLDDRYLTEQCKQLRHDLAALLDRLPSKELLTARETQADVGTTLSTPSEEHRADAAGVFAANFARLQESLRSLEEYGKLIDPTWAAEFKQLRYRTYTLHRAVEITRNSLDRLANSRLYILIDGRSSIDDFRQLSQRLIDAGVHILQSRDKNLDDRQLLERGRLLRDLIRGTKTIFIMNDRPDLAFLCQADGVHLGQEDVSVKDARAILGTDAIIGVSIHSIEQARQAVLDGANYIGVGPTFPSETKQFTRFPGLELLRAVAAEIRLPAFAIGGISLDNVSQILATGITRIALSGAIINSPDPAAVIKELLTMF